MTSNLAQPDDAGNGAGEAFPFGGLAVERALPGARERVELGAPPVLGDFPLGAQPALLLELVKCGIERAVADTQVIARYLAQPLADGPGVQRFERDNLEEQEVERALDEIGRSCHVPSVTEGTLSHFPSVSKGRWLS